MTECTVGDYLLRRLQEVGVRHVFGVPGDYQLEFLDQIEATEGLSWVGNCNELNAAYAADGYARLNGIAALVTTFSVGELSALNGVGGACAESVPLVSIVGTPATFVMRRRRLVHHTRGDRDFTHAARCAAEYTVGQAMLDRNNAATEIDRLLGLCWLWKRPVYFMLPSDVATQHIDAPSAPLVLPSPTSDPTDLAGFVDQARTRLHRAASVAMLVGHEVDRYRLSAEVIELAEALACPVATLSSAKGVFPEQHDLFAGGYAGALSDPAVRRIVEEADCLIAAGTELADSVTGGFTAHLARGRVIELHPSTATVAGVWHGQVSMRDALRAMTEPPQRKAFPRYRPAPAALESASGPLSQERFWPRLGAFFEPGDVIIAEQGTSYFGSADILLPTDCTFIGQPLWGSIGYTLPALLGTMLAAPDRRHILLIGDGSFQLTAQELATILRLRLNPVIVLVNNEGYTVERYIQGPEAAYNTIAPWRYDRLVEAFDPSDRTVTLQVRTEEELTAALATAAAGRDRPIFVEAVMQPLDAPSSAVAVGRAFAASDYHRL
ncbi:alpha-keto acid decarboxylase family protein [Dactylosporangium sp. NPDC051485]|uniref:alpha-keto acid decarboxylase family protein n=1 Tax=Dactylosporangium sp. NPDC051485 TaxID=3154846 RepID=UPI00344095D2